MPIRAEMRPRYPRDWKTRIVPEIRARSGNRCECTGQCGDAHDGPQSAFAGRRCWAPHGRMIRRLRDFPAIWTLDTETHPLLPAAHFTRAVKVVLTTAHLDHVPEHWDPSNLLHLCQRCHLLLDRHEHVRNAAETRRRRRAAGDLFAGPYPQILQR